MAHVKFFYERKLMKVCEDPEMAENILEDQNKIMTIISISYIFKTLKLLIVIFLLSYFLGVIYYIICDLVREYSGDHYENNFIKAFMDGKSNKDRTIAVTYFAFTTLSTVGFGDLVPKNEVEYLITAFILLFGVAIFSYVMGNFIEIFTSFNQINAGFDDGDNLSKFFGLIKQFNKGQSINIKMQNEIEDYFEYRWNNDKN